MGILLSTKKLVENEIDLLSWNEVFSQVPQWNNYYISNYGRLLHKNKKGRLTVINPSIVTGGYLQYSLSAPARRYKGKKVRDKNGKPKTRKKNMYAHRLVAELYVNSQYPDDYRIEDLQVHHKDKRPQNNYYKNLMYLETSAHKFVDSIKQIGSYNRRTGRVYTYSDIERLSDKAGINVIDFIEHLRFGESEKIGKYNIYNINGYEVAVQFFKKKKK